ncbi:unnamed protein product [Toxocara canis]|uniref:DUF753 domain-containing protein n=1 Tax=Toxocara canis TaxID=6265 RepID=A0A183UNZ3_TOXCA|nr:unnamed protein product [Toxocara canis]
MIVRGCQRRLTGISANIRNESFATAQSFCEYDKDFARLNSGGEIVYIKSLVEFCNGDSCNSRIKDFASGEKCVGQNTDRLDNAGISCFDCISTNGNCFSSREACSKKYCFKSNVDIHGVPSVYKTCADFSPYGPNAACGHSTLTIVPGDMAKLDGSLTQCFCNDKHYCNSASVRSISAFAMIILGIVSVFRFV